MKVTLVEIANEAGVSVATVDRVLNDREGVRQRTRDLVLNVARRRGWFGAPETAEQLIKIDFVVPGGSNTFLALLRKYLLEEAQSIGGIEAKVHIIDSLEPEALAARLTSLLGQTDAVGVVALDHPMVRAAIDQLSGSGIPVASLVSDIPSVNKVGYVGIDNRSAGRLAGLLMGRFLHPEQTHKVAVFLGSLSYRGHEEREMGFRSIVAQEFKNLSIEEIVEINDDRDKAFEEMMRVIETTRPDAVYNIGGGTQGIGRALKEMNLNRDVVFIAHDLTDATKTMLIDRTLDAIIDQNPRVEAREVVKLLAGAVKGAQEPQYLPRLQVIFAENIPNQ